MKAIAVLAVTLAIFVSSSANEDKRARILKFYNCLSCHEDPTVKEEFVKCLEKKPEKSRKVANDCKEKIMPGATTLEERWDIVCKNKGEESEKLYECIMNPEHKKDLTDDEKTQMKEFVTCVKKMNMKFCDSH